MISKLTKKIGLFCLCLASLSLAGCFHIPDEDWLPSKNKVKTEDMKKENEEVEQAINSLVDGFNTISTQGNDMDENEITEENKGDENNENNNKEGNENIDGTEVDIDENEENDTISGKNDTGNNITN